MEKLKKLCLQLCLAVAILIAAVVVAVSTHTMILICCTSLSFQQIVFDCQRRLLYIRPADSIAAHYKAQYSPGIASLAYTLTRFGDTVSEAELMPANRKQLQSLDELEVIAHQYGHHFVKHEATIESLPRWKNLPVIALMLGGRYLVVHNVEKERVIAFDSESGEFIALSKVVFQTNWTGQILEMSFADIK